MTPAEPRRTRRPYCLHLEDRTNPAGPLSSWLTGPLTPGDNNLLLYDTFDRVAVRVTATNITALMPSLTSLGFLGTAMPSANLAEGYFPIAKMSSLVPLAGNGLLGVIPVFRAIPSAGSVTSEGDLVHESARLRSQPPAGITIDGQGTTIGVISDSFDRRPDLPTTAAKDVATGDLPLNVQIVSDGPQYNNDPLNPNVTDEGRAMTQVAFDLAPGANYAFASGAQGEVAYTQNLSNLLATAKPNVVVDDLVYPGEPFFQDGIVAQSVTKAVNQNNVVFLVAAGNFGRDAYESLDFQGTADPVIAKGTFHDFDASSTKVDTRQSLTLLPGQRVTLALQWDDPFYTTDKVGTDLDLFLVTPGTGAVLAGAKGGTDDNLTSQIPLEVVDYTNTTGSTQTVELLIRLTSGAVPQRLKYVNYAAGVNGGVKAEYVTDSPTVVPHAAAPGAVGVGAVAFFDQDVAQPYSSAGPATYLFQPDGTAFAVAETRPGVQIAGADGVNNTFFGQDIAGDPDTFPNFFGTSAAAAHAAAAVAQVRQVNPTLSPAELVERLTTTARDLDPPGFDPLTGAGLFSAYRGFQPQTISAFAGQAFTFDDFAPGNTFFIEPRANGRLRTTDQFGPIGARHVVLDSFFTDPARPSLTELILQVQALSIGPLTVSFSAKEFNEADDPMPPTFTGSVNADGVAFSTDGVTWTRLVSLTGTAIGPNYQGYVFDLTAAAANAGVALNSTTLVKFQRYGTGSADANTGGIAFDQIVIGSAFPTTVLFTGNAGPAGLTWFDPDNWSTNAVPGPDDNVVIDFQGGVARFDQPLPGVVKSLITNTPLAISAGSLQVQEVGAFKGQLTLSGGELGGPGPVTAGGGFVWTGGRLGGANDFVIPAGATATLAEGVKEFVGRRVVNRGAATWLGGDIKAANATWVVESGGSFTADTAVSTTWVFDGSVGGPPPVFEVKSGGTFRKFGPGQTTFFARFQAAGGTLTVADGQALAAGGGSWSGAVAITDGTFQLGGPAADHDFSAVTVTGAGRVKLTEGRANVAAGPLSNLTHFDLAGGEVLGPGTLAVLGSMTWNGGGLSGGTLRLATGAKLDIDSDSDLEMAGHVVDNSGTVTWIDADEWQTGGGQWINRKNGTFNWLADVSWQFNPALGAEPTPVLIEAGSVFRRGGFEPVTLAGPLTVNGQLNLDTAGLNLTGGLTNLTANQLTGGEFLLKRPLRVPPGAGQQIEINATKLELDFEGDITDPLGNSLLGGLKSNAVNGTLALLGGKVQNVTGGFGNSGLLQIASKSVLRLGPGAEFLQDGGRTLVFGQLIAPGGFAYNGGSVGGSGGLFTGQFVNRGLLQPGESPGDMKLEGDFDQDSGGELEIEIAGIDPGEHDEVIVIGDVNLDGDLTVVALAPDLPVGGTWRIINNQGPNPVNGTFIDKPQGAIFRAGDGQAFQISYTAGTGNDVFLTRVAAPAKVAPLTVGDGDPQRSRVAQIVVPFDTKVSLPANASEAFELTRTGPSGTTGPVALTANFDPLANPSVVTLTFGGGLTESGSLIDGNYQLTVLAAKVLVDGVQLDGNGDGTGGDDFTATVFRLFGDDNGDRAVNFSDFLAFRGTFGLGSVSPAFLPWMDFDNDGAVNFSDFLQFRTRFGTTLAATP